MGRHTAACRRAASTGSAVGDHCQAGQVKKIVWYVFGRAGSWSPATTAGMGSTWRKLGRNQVSLTHGRLCAMLRRTHRNDRGGDYGTLHHCRRRPRRRSEVNSDALLHGGALGRLAPKSEIAELAGVTGRDADRVTSAEKQVMTRLVADGLLLLD